MPKQTEQDFVRYASMYCDIHNTYAAQEAEQQQREEAYQSSSYNSSSHNEFRRRSTDRKTSGTSDNRGYYEREKRGPIDSLPAPLQLAFYIFLAVYMFGS